MNDITSATSAGDEQSAQVRSSAAKRRRDAHAGAGATFAENFTPLLLTNLRAGYGAGAFRADVIAGLTVAVVALPLSMAIAIAAGLPPERGLFAAIVGGCLVSMLGGSRYQIGGPAGAFIVLIATIGERHGYDGLVLATLMAGVLMIAGGFLKLGSYIKYIPFPVTVGFTAGIAVIIFASQVGELLGLGIEKEPAALLPKLTVIGTHLRAIDPAAVAISALGVVIILGLRKWRPHWPGLLIAVAACTLAAVAFKLNIATIGSRFGGIPSGLPAPSLPSFDSAAGLLTKMQLVFPDALAIALLGSIESLLSAVVADGMSGERHRSNGEIVAQGVANIGSVIFGGMCVTGTIARTATNVRAGAHGPVAGMLHAAFLLVFMLIAAPLAAFIPLAALGAVLAIVAWNMFEKREFWGLLRTSWGDAAVLLATFLLTIFIDLLSAIAVGVTMGAFIFLHRMAEAVQVESGQDADTGGAEHAGIQTFNDDVVVYRISGAFFFGATARVGSVLERIGVNPKKLVLDFSAVPLVDSSAAHALEHLAHQMQKNGTRVYVASANRNVRRTLLAAGLRRPLVRYVASVDDGV